MGGSHAKKKPGFRNPRKENYVCRMSPTHQAVNRPPDVIRPRKLTNPILDSPSHQDLHRELLLAHKTGLLPGEKPELQRVLEQRRLEQHREQEQALQPPSDLEQELRKRQQKLQEYEREERKRREDQENIPEFVRVKESLRHIQATGQ
ncbi:protein FAM107B-like isoform X1 [Lepisosteus oculatus]|uniref:protein FAM107B-like isoform X1 n=2 Tax=Lepisosteus oculatus TaxID=7918 RepID=UPI0007402A25|nr:PREDICTED: protein FAM107B-like isoform X2 [Lepisosteus oculatus]XP_015197868.1 PREDICTED: protein FAM107B-like isoform X2 [Lepisosteus oculatus]